MNLIEQLGGYDVANSKLLKMDKILKEVYYSHSDAQKANELRQALIEYRREHGIFENGDKVIYPWLGNEICTYSDSFTIKSPFRHATPAEIQAGKRLN